LIVVRYDVVIIVSSANTRLTLICVHISCNPAIIMGSDFFVDSRNDKVIVNLHI